MQLTCYIGGVDTGPKNIYRPKEEKQLPCAAWGLPWSCSGRAKRNQPESFTSNSINIKAAISYASP